MIALALETASRLVGVAVGEIDDNSSSVWAEFMDTRGRRHVEALMPAVQFVLDEVGMGLTDIGIVVVDIGPGLFAGLRVGISTAKALATALGVPIVAVPSLDALAYSVVGGFAGLVPENVVPENIDIVAVLDAKRGEVFWSCYRLKKETGIERVVDYRATPPELLVEWLTNSAGHHVLVGDGALAYANHFDPIGAYVYRGDEYIWPKPSALLHLASNKDGYPIHERPGDIEPIYLRRADARINWEQRQHL